MKGNAHDGNALRFLIGPHAAEQVDGRPEIVASRALGIETDAISGWRAFVLGFNFAFDLGTQVFNDPLAADAAGTEELVEQYRAAARQFREQTAHDRGALRCQIR
ncbi:MAG TPA: hypothetical protein VIG51_06445 [Candidatus Baltobacteraceae bacterium]